jgi:hypothetical protein
VQLAVSPDIVSQEHGNCLVTEDHLLA